MHRIALLLAVLAMHPGTAAMAQESQDSLFPPGTELTSEKELEALSEKALEHLVRGELEGFEGLRAHAVDFGDKESANRFFRSRAEGLKDFGRKWGKPLGSTLVARRRIGDSLRQYIYLSKYENNVLRWSFTYYRPRETWRFFRLDFNDNVNALFDDVEDSQDAAPANQPGASTP